MPKPGKSRNFIRSLSPVSPGEGEFDAALDVLNNSLDTRMITEMMESRTDGSIEDVTARILSESPNDQSIYAVPDTSVILKCQSLIDDLQEELDAQRIRNNKLESDLIKSTSELKSMQAESFPERISELEALNANLERKLHVSHQSLVAKEDELENMTRHFEKRMDEMKRQLKQQAAIASTPPLPSQAPVVANDHSELDACRSLISQKESELRDVVESYERQVSMLKQQLSTSQSFFKSYYAAKYKPGESVRSNPFRDY